jgi:hypothetical protein
MSTFAESLSEIKKPWQWIAIGGAVVLIWAGIALPGLHRSAPDTSVRREVYVPPARSYYSAPEVQSAARALPRPDAAKAKPVSLHDAAPADEGRKAWAGIW